MAAKKRHHQSAYYAEDSFSDSDSEMEQDHEEHENRRPGRGRPRKTGYTTAESATAGTAMEQGSLTGSGAPQQRKRGRGPSKRPCLNRNALMARENRQRKKEYIERIEARLRVFQQENQELNGTIQRQALEIKKLSKEVVYLKNVLNNNSVITSLLSSMNESLGRMHGPDANKPCDAANAAAACNGLDKPADFADFAAG